MYGTMHRCDLGRAVARLVRFIAICLRKKGRKKHEDREHDPGPKVHAPWRDLTGCAIMWSRNSLVGP